MCSFEISNMYPCVPTQQVFDMINNLCHSMGIPETITLELSILVRTITEENYFEHNLASYKQTDGLAMDAHTSPIFSKVFVEHVEYNHILIIYKSMGSLHTTGMLIIF
jgi:hypothetical protein